MSISEYIDSPFNVFLLPLQETWVRTDVLDQVDYQDYLEYVKYVDKVIY